MSKHLNDFRLVTALVNKEIDNDGNYIDSEYELTLELFKSFNATQLQKLHQRLDDLKIDIEKLILIRS